MKLKTYSEFVNETINTTMPKKALSTSEANNYLIELGYKNLSGNTIEDNEFTEPFGKTDYSIRETNNMFDKNHEHRWFEFTGKYFNLYISENSNGQSYLGIMMYDGHNGRRVVDYNKLKAADKKKFIAIFDELATRKQEYTLPQTNTSGVYTVYGDALPKGLENIHS